MAELHKYSGAGNDFVVLDGRTEDVSAFRTPERIAALCAQHGTDGLMILTEGGEGLDFRMEYYNSDGSGGMMCGNGGRCIVAFADALGIAPGDGRVYRFAAADGLHTGEILSREGGRKTVRLRMIDVREFRPALDGWFLDTGTRHFVRFVPDAEAVDVEKEGRAARWDPLFAPVGANANFVSVDPDGTLRVRTFEKGVEGETLACGTGITAAAIAAALEYGGISPEPPTALKSLSDFADGKVPGPGRSADADFASLKEESRRRTAERKLVFREPKNNFRPPVWKTPSDGVFGIDIQARIARLSVEFRPLPDGSGFTDVYLTGPAEEIEFPDYQQFFSEDVGSFMRSPVREIFKKVDLASIYSFAGGYPDAATFPIDDIRRISAQVLEKYGAKALQYGATQGVPELRQVIARRCGVPVANVQITTSSQQGIDVCTRVLADPGDVILTTSPTYLGALQSFRAYRADVRTLDAFDFSRPVKFCYVIPDFQNPSGETMTLQERQALVELARKHDFLIVEDSPYRELRYSGEPVPTIYSLAPERTLHLGSFSKIFAPGFRLGWILGPEALLDQIYVCKQALDLCPPIFDQYIAAEFMGSGALDANLQKSIALYRAKRDRMLALLEQYMPQGVSWTHPEGGLFLFLTLPEGCDTVALYDRALSAGVAYVAGSFFFVDGSHRNTMRLNFSFLDASRMEAGIKLLAEVIGV